MLALVASMGALAATMLADPTPQATSPLMAPMTTTSDFKINTIEPVSVSEVASAHTYDPN